MCHTFISSVCHQKLDEDIRIKLQGNFGQFYVKYISGFSPSFSIGFSLMDSTIYYPVAKIIKHAV